MTFLEAVNRVFRLNGLIRGDTDPITSFAQIQHNASINLAQIAIQDELVDLASRKQIDYERENGEILTDGSRVYDLPEDFRAFEGRPHFVTNETEFIEYYPGGLSALEYDDPLYQTTSSGEATHWYWESTTSKKIGFWPVPSTGATYTYRYQKSVMIFGAGESLPFHNNEEAYAFCTMAGRRFKFLYETPEKPADLAQVLEADLSYRSARTALANLMRGKNQTEYYGHVYQ